MTARSSASGANQNGCAKKVLYKYGRSVFERDHVGLFFDQAAQLKMIDDNYAGGKTDDRRKIWTVVIFPTCTMRTVHRRHQAGKSSPSTERHMRHAPVPGGVVLSGGA